jgi:hypothetical protein
MGVNGLGAGHTLRNLAYDASYRNRNTTEVAAQTDCWAIIIISANSALNNHLARGNVFRKHII